MSLILRQSKATPLTFEELDSNFQYLNNSILELGTTLQSGAAIPDSYIRNLFRGGPSILYDNNTGVISLNVANLVTGINGSSGNVVLTTDDIPEGTRNAYYNEEHVINFIRGSIKVSNGLSRSVDAAGAITIAPRNFGIRLVGSVVGNATVTALNDVVIDTELSESVLALITNLAGESSGSSATPGISGLRVRSPGQLSDSEFLGIEFSAADFNVVANDTYVTISNKLSNADIVTAVGNVMSGSVFYDNLTIPSESGIIVTFDQENGAIRVAPRDFSISIAGAVTGTAKISRLQDTVITVSNTNNYISGLDVRVNSIKKNTKPIDTINFSSDNFAIAVDNDIVTVGLLNQLTPADIRDIIGNTIVGTERDLNSAATTETGIIVNYDAQNNVLEVSPRDFSISIAGAVTGTATISRLKDTVITVSNTNNYISGLDVQTGGTKRNTKPIDTINFNPSNFDIAVDNDVVTVGLLNQLTPSDIRDIIGNTIVGTERDLNSAATTETGIIVNYDAQNNVLEVSPRDFKISLIGDVVGNATISRLSDVSINTVTSAIKGLAVDSNDVPLTTLAKKLNFSDNFMLSAAGDTVDVDIRSVIDSDTILAAVTGAQTGSQNGIIIAYDTAEKQLSYNLSNLQVSLNGAVSGSATLAYSGQGTQSLNITTEIGEIGSGLEIRDEGTTKGQSIAAINFVGAGVTSSVTVDGQIATVNIPNSPGAEKFILIDSGSANVPNARRLVGGTGIALNDGGAGGDIVISAVGGDVLGKIQVEGNGNLVAEEPTINFVNSQQVFVSATHDAENNTINIVAYSKEDGWWRSLAMDHGAINDKYGNSLDLGNISVGIIEHQIDFGEIA